MKMFVLIAVIVLFGELKSSNKTSQLIPVKGIVMLKKCKSVNIL